MQEVMTVQEWGMWRNQPESIAFFEMLEIRIEQAKELWSQGAFVSKDLHFASLNNHAALSKVEAMREICQMDFEGYLTTVRESK